MNLTHLALTVSDHERAKRFYETHFGFDGPATRYPGGVVIIRNRHGFDLALEQGEPSDRPAFFHFGFRLSDPEEVRRHRDRLRAERVPLLEEEDSAAYVGFKCLDPDGYRIEVYWEP